MLEGISVARVAQLALAAFVRALHPERGVLTSLKGTLRPGFDGWERHVREGLVRMIGNGKLRKDAAPAALATATMASIQGGLLLTQVRRDPQQLCVALNSRAAARH